MSGSTTETGSVPLGEHQPMVPFNWNDIVEDDDLEFEDVEMESDPSWHPSDNEVPDAALQPESSVSAPVSAAASAQHDAAAAPQAVPAPAIPAAQQQPEVPPGAQAAQQQQYGPAAPVVQNAAAAVAGLGQNDPAANQAGHVPRDQIKTIQDCVVALTQASLAAQQCAGKLAAALDKVDSPAKNSPAAKEARASKRKQPREPDAQTKAQRQAAGPSAQSERQQEDVKLAKELRLCFKCTKHCPQDEVKAHRQACAGDATVFRKNMAVVRRLHGEGKVAEIKSRKPILPPGADK